MELGLGRQLFRYFYSKLTENHPYIIGLSYKIFSIIIVLQVNISVPDDEWFEEWTSDDFVALPERVDVAYENEHYNPKLQYLTGVARDDASYMICKNVKINFFSNTFNGLFDEKILYLMIMS